jgi:Leucine-rich repeat (LRR) protein
VKSADNFNSSVDPIIAHFEAEGNQFTGTIPSRFGTLPSLKSLDLHKNKLDSEIPKNICDGLNRSLKKLDLSSNMNLKGKIPDEIGKCTDLGECILPTSSSITSFLPSCPNPPISSYFNIYVVRF